MKWLDETLLDVFRRKRSCEWCGAASRGRLEPHHAAVKRGCGGGSRLDLPLNLIALCPVFVGGSCHDLVEHGDITREDMLAKIASREGLSQDEIIAAVNRLLRAPKEARPCEECWGSGREPAWCGNETQMCSACLGAGCLIYGEPWRGA